METENETYQCLDCGETFSCIPVFGCPCCKSENYYKVEDIEELEESLGCGSYM